MTVVDLQVSPASHDWTALREFALEAEAAGFGAFHVFDHLAGRSLGGSTMIECFALLGALAEATTTISLGTMVVNVWNREVGTLVTAAASVVAISGRPLILGVGAGTSPTSPWAAEQRAVSARIEPDLDRRHARVQELLDLAAHEWSATRADALATFPLPDPVPSIVIGVNSVALARCAGRSADGVNVAWQHPRRDEFLAAAADEAGGRPFLRTVYQTYDGALLDPEHPDRALMRSMHIDRLVLSVFDTVPELPTSV